MANRKRWLSVLLRTLAFLMLLPALLYLLLLLFNLRDDPLSPQVEKLLTDQPPAVAPNKNGYFAYIGILGPEDQDPHTWGVQWFEKALADDKALRAGAKPKAWEKVREETPNWRGLPCARVNECLSEVAAKPAVARTALQQGKASLARGDTALAYPAYGEIVRPDFLHSSEFPRYGSNWNTLSAIRFSVNTLEGRHGPALAQLEREIAFCIRQLAGSSSLIHRMVSLANLRSRYYLLSQYIQRYPDEAKRRKDAIQRMLPEWPTAAISMRIPLREELRFVANVFANMQNETRWGINDDGDWELQSNSIVDKLTATLFLPNATVNDYAENLEMWLRAANQEGEAYRKALLDAQKAQGDKSSFSLRNPAGRFMLAAGPDWGSYFGRHDDLLAMRALLLFQLDLVARGIYTPQHLAQAIEDNKALLMHRYTGGLPSWSAEYKELSYPPIDSQFAQHRIFVKLP